MFSRDSAGFDRILAMRLTAAIATEGSFSAAGRALGLSPATVTKEIQKLEAHLGTTVFHRTTRRVSLTEAGYGYLNAATEILSRIEAAEAAIMDRTATPRGHLRVTAPAVLGSRMISQVLGQFLAVHPQIRAELVLTDRVIDIGDEGFDVAIRTAFELPDLPWYAKRLCEVRRILCASPEYLEARGSPSRLRDLSHHTCLIFIRGRAEKEWTFTKAKGDGGRTEERIRVDGAFRSNSLIALAEAAAAGLGIANVPAYAVSREIEEGRLVRLFPSYRIPTHSAWIIYQRRREESPKLSAFLDFMERRFRGRVLG